MEQLDKARAEFEKWAFAQYGDAISLSHDGLLYAEPFVQTLFIGWQAAKEQYAPREAAVALSMELAELCTPLEVARAKKTVEGQVAIGEI